ncbi:MAG: site-specific DNA-methyltransferase [Christensenellales bacterium]
MDIRTLLLSELNPAKYNPRKELCPGDAEFEKLKRSIESFGYVELIVVNEATGFTVISGHQRLSVLKTLDYESVECVVVCMDEVQEKALNIAMNKISGEWDTKKLGSLLSDLKAEDFDVTLTGFDTSEIGLMLGVEDEIVQDEVPEVDAYAPTICQPGELWQLGRHRLLCGSSTDKNDVALLMDGQYSKLLFTSPPYSDMREYNGGKDLSVESIVGFIDCYEPFTALQAVNLGIQRKDSEVNPYWDAYIASAKSVDLKLLAWNVWDKLTCGSVGQQSAMIPIRHEWIFCFGKEPVRVNPTWRKKEASIYSGGRYNKIRQADGSFRIARRGNETGAFKKMESLLELPEQTSLESVTKQLSEKGKIRADHPATFPVSLPSEYIVAFTDEGNIVVEPFGGAGTTLIACEQLDRTCYIMELDAHYCDVIIKRWENFTGNKAKKRES